MTNMTNVYTKNMSNEDLLYRKVRLTTTDNLSSIEVAELAEINRRLRVNDRSAPRVYVTVQGETWTSFASVVEAEAFLTGVAVYEPDQIGDLTYRIERPDYEILAPGSEAILKYLGEVVTVIEPVGPSKRELAYMVQIEEDKTPVVVPRSDLVALPEGWKSAPTLTEAVR